MKNLVMFVAVVVMAITSYSATCSWTATFIAQDPDNGALNAMTAYLIDVNTVASSDMVSALNQGDVSLLAKNVNTTTTLKQSEGNARVGLTGWGEYNKGDEYTYYMVVLNEANTYYMMSKELTAKVPENGGALSMGFKNMTTGEYAGTWTAMAPEPTSGLLMIVGGALLALRRKQK